MRRLLAAQFPQWGSFIDGSPAGPQRAYRLGDDMAVRMPRIDWAIDQVEKEQRWLPKLAPLLPLDIPLPLAQGAPGEGYPWDWTICRWLEGEEATAENVPDLRRAALDLARFIAALQRIDPAGGPHPGEHNSWRGVPLYIRDASVRRPSPLWTACSTPAPHRRGKRLWMRLGGIARPCGFTATCSPATCWRDGRICAVIDFGCLGVGDPACDLLPA